MTILVAGGVLQLRSLGKNSITRDGHLPSFASRGIVHLGQVKRLYFEAAGTYTFLKEDEPSPGLGIWPGHDQQLELHWYCPSDRMVCEKCGMVAPYHDYSGQ